LIAALVAVMGIPAAATGGGHGPSTTAAPTTTGCTALTVQNASITFDAATNTVTARFDTSAGCEREVTFAVYRKLCDAAEFCLPQQLVIYVTNVVQPNQSYQWVLTIPDRCDRWQIDLAYGQVIQDLSQGTYGSRLIKSTFVNMDKCQVTTTTTQPTTTTASTTTTSSTTTSTTTSTTAPSTTTSSTTSTTASTTTSSTTSSTASTTTSTTASTTTTTAPPTTTAPSSTTTGSTPNDQEVENVEVEVLGIQATNPVQAQVGTDTLPFTGISTSSMVGLGAALAAGGAILLAASRRTEERNAKRSWN
jgi:hypothetical protein